MGQEPWKKLPNPVFFSWPEFKVGKYVFGIYTFLLAWSCCIVNTIIPVLPVLPCCLCAPIVPMVNKNIIGYKWNGFLRRCFFRLQNIKITYVKSGYICTRENFYSLAVHGLDSVHSRWKLNIDILHWTSKYMQMSAENLSIKVFVASCIYFSAC